MKTIKLTRGKVVLVDDADFHWLLQWKWYARKAPNTWYAGRSSYSDNGRCGIVYMHRQIMGFPKEVDHRNRNGLDNRRENLRVGHRSGQAANSRTRAKSIYRGVSKIRGKFFARIHKNGKAKYLGVFNTAIEAAKAFDRAALNLHGEFATLNFPVV